MNVNICIVHFVLVSECLCILLNSIV